GVISDVDSISSPRLSSVSNVSELAGSIRLDSKMEPELIEANGLQFHVRDAGSGAPVILLHGFPDTGDLWRNQVPALVQNGFRTIVPDMRGRGGSSKPENVSDYRLSTIVRDVTGIMDALGIERAHVVGHDWSAAVAWLLAALAPERVDRLVAISV